MEQIERIQYYETILDEANTAIRDLTTALDHYHQVYGKLKELEAYYESPLWMKDYTDDEAGKIPEDLKRGVLSEDAVYNLLSEHDNLIRGLKNSSQR